MTARPFKYRPDRRCSPDEPSNGDRAGFAESGVLGFLAATGEAQQVDEDSIRDLLADLLHLCDREGLDALSLVRTAKADWEFER